MGEIIFRRLPDKGLLSNKNILEGIEYASTRHVCCSCEKSEIRPIFMKPSSILYGIVFLNFVPNS